MDDIPKNMDWFLYSIKRGSLPRHKGNGLGDYVPNQNGGFMGFWWVINDNKDQQVYLQLEDKKLCLKIRVKVQERNGKDKKETTRKRSEMRDELSKRVLNSPELGKKFKRPKRFGNGETMTVSECKNYLKTTEEGKIDCNATISFIKETTALCRRDLT